MDDRDLARRLLYILRSLLCNTGRLMVFSDRRSNFGSAFERYSNFGSALGRYFTDGHTQSNF